MCVLHYSVGTSTVLLLLKEVDSARLGERITLYQFNDPSPTIPTYGQKEEKEKNSRRQKGIEKLRPIKRYCPALETRQSHTTNTGSAISFHWETEKGMKVLRY